MPGPHGVSNKDGSCACSWPGLARMARQLHWIGILLIVTGPWDSPRESRVAPRRIPAQRETDSTMAESKRSIYVAIAADAGIAVSKFVAGGFSGSSSMLAEGIHSVIDAGIVSLMLVGVNRSEKPPDPRHPFGHSQELYYWTNVVALLLFSLGGGMTLLEGVNRLINPHA